MIDVRGITKTFKVHQKEPGLAGSLAALFTRKWQNKTALLDVSLSVKPGEILGLVGANGAGKTTLVKILSGIIPATAGKASVLGFDPWKRKKEFRRQISLIMGQKAQLWWDLPAADCFTLLKEIYEIPKTEFKGRLDELVETLGVEDLLKTQIRRLSLGERMKMELVAALLHRPKIIFLDEPTIGLDITAQKAIRKFLLDYRSRYGPAMIITSHYMDDIEELCPRIAILREGQVVYDGALQKILSEHANYKIVALHTENGPGSLRIPEGIEAEIVSQDLSGIQVRVRRDHTAKAVEAAFGSLRVTDLEIHEENIGTIIESIMKERA